MLKIPRFRQEPVDFFSVQQSFEILRHELAGLQYFDFLITRYIEQVLVPAYNHLVPPSQRAGNEFVIIGVLANLFGERRRSNDFCVLGKKFQYRVQINVRMVFSQDFSHPVVLC